MGLFESKPEGNPEDAIVLPVNPTSVEDFGYVWKQGMNFA